jgi:sugar phosphate permease
MLIQVDHGTLPGCADKVQLKLNINDFEYGVLGSLVYLGLMFGSATATGLYSKGHLIKPILGFSLMLNSICLAFFTTSTSFYVLGAMRFLTGFCQIFIIVYYPVWTDTFGPEKFKSIWLTLMLLASPLGLVLGYAVTYYMNMYKTWEWSFYL